ncbi:MAG: rRNA pseudouridine synthase [Betaproteobacteria bacterium]|nr:rRNA pseudouridine synthase [Betaproteobacteria bacterium]
MVNQKKTLRLPEGKRSTHSETAAKPPRSHKPWSQALAKKRSPRVAGEVTDAKAGAKDSTRHSRTSFASRDTEKRTEKRFHERTEKQFDRREGSERSVFSERRGGSTRFEERSANARSRSPDERLRSSSDRSRFSEDRSFDGRSADRRSSDRRSFRQGNTESDSSRAPRPYQQRDEDRRRFDRNSRNTESRNIESRGFDSRDGDSRSSVSRGASSRRSSSEFREERPFKKASREETTWRGRSESAKRENREWENRERESRPRYDTQYDKKPFERREGARTRNTKAENFGTENFRSEKFGTEKIRSEKPQAFVKKTAAPSLASSPLTGVRVSKLLSARGLCSRREADEYIERGWVRVNGQRVTLGARAQPDDEITLSPQAKRQQSRRVTVLLHKPIGYVSGQPEPGYQPAIVLVTPENQCAQEGDPPFSAAHLRSLAPAGRLDIDSTGLLILTQDGRVARDLIGETSSIEKEYLVRVEGTLSDENLALLNHGLSLDDEALKPARVEWINDDQLRFVLREGKKRQIRRMCEAVGLTVTGLKRVRVGNVRLGDLPVGQWRYLRDDESFGG